MALEWKEKYEIGDRKIDAEHQEWFRLANTFLVTDDELVMNRTGEVFYQYTLHHFFHEEVLMHELQYPFIASHIKEHERLVNTLRKILEVGKNELAKDELEDFVGYWLLKHITSYDAPFTVYVRRNCVASPM
jgi:putative two-component system hydrogenase maturation factor HypX/HoxX